MAKAKKGENSESPVEVVEDDIEQIDIFEEAVPPETDPETTISEPEIEKLFASGQFSLVLDRNDFLIPQVTEFVSTSRWINLKPEYQRRRRWDNVKSSRLIESVLMNVPIPPVFLYEYELARYEVMDGQQRLSAIHDFYDDRLRLSGLDVWKALNRKKFSDLPDGIKKRLQRRKISAVIVQLESEVSRREGSEPQIDLRREVFQRLNTGGERLNPQELRHALYAGDFNKLILDLSRGQAFTELWSIPLYKDYESERAEAVSPRRENHLFQTMSDCQIVLRFFAFLDKDKIKGSTRRALDTAMKDGRKYAPAQIEALRKRFTRSLDVLIQVFGSNAIVVASGRTGRPSRPLWDALMVGLQPFLDTTDELVQKRELIQERLAALVADKKTYVILVGKPNTADAIRARIDLIESMIRGALA